MISSYHGIQRNYVCHCHFCCHHKFVAQRKRSLCFMECVFQDILTWRISQFAKLSSTNVFMQWICKIFLLPKFPSIRYISAEQHYNQVNRLNFPTPHKEKCDQNWEKPASIHSVIFWETHNFNYSIHPTLPMLDCIYLCWTRDMTIYWLSVNKGISNS